MTDTTTIEIRDDQQEELAALKQHPKESYKEVVDRLLDDSAESINATVGVDTTEIVERLERIESSTREATNAAQQNAKTLEELQR